MIDGKKNKRVTLIRSERRNGMTPLNVSSIGTSFATLLIM